MPRNMVCLIISIYFALFSQRIKLPTTKGVQVGAGTLSGLMGGFFTTTVLTDYCFGLGGVILGTTLGAYVFKRIPNRIFRYIVYAYIAISSVIILMTN